MQGNPLTKYLLSELLIALTGMTACTSFETDKLQYKSAESHKAPTLDLPPDVAQLTRGTAYAVRGGGVSVKDYRSDLAAAPAASTALTRVGDVRMAGTGTQHWLVADRPVEALWGRSSPPKVPLRFRIMVQGEGEATVVSVLDAAGAADATDDARRIVKVLSDDLN